MGRRAWEAAAPPQSQGLRWRGRPLTATATIRPGERIGVSLFFAYAFLLLVAYYILKTLREPLLLSDGSAELKSYAYAVIALVLLPLVPLYSVAFRRIEKDRLTRWITIFFLCNLAVFCFAAGRGTDIGFAYYVWVGVFGGTMLALFWSHAADAFNVQGGQRLIPAIVAGASLGGLVGPPLVRFLYGALEASQLMLIAGTLLAVTLPLVGWTRHHVPAGLRNSATAAGPRSTSPLGGFALVLGDRYLLLLTILVVLLNCVNTTGEYMLAEWVTQHAAAAAERDPTFHKGEFIASFYGNFFLAVNALTLIAQVFLVPRLIRRIGVPGALLVLPVIAAIGYGLLVFVPIFGILRLLKLLENSVDYSVTNTCRQALYLPLSTSAKYEGKMAIDGFFPRFGDIIQAAVIFAGLNWLGFGLQHFALLNVLLALICVAVAIELAKRYQQRVPAARRATRFPLQALCHRVTPRSLPSLGFGRALTALSACALSLLALTGPAGIWGV